MLLNFLMGVTGLLLAGSSIGRGIWDKDIKAAAFGIIYLIPGLYFTIAAIGGSAT